MNENRVIIVQYFGQEIPENVLENFVANVHAYVASQDIEKNISVTLLNQEDLTKLLAKSVTVKQHEFDPAPSTSALKHATTYVSEITKNAQNSTVECISRLLTRATEEKRNGDMRLYNALQIIIEEWRKSDRRVMSFGISRAKFKAIELVYNSVY